MFELDTARNILLRNGNEIRLQPQPLTILVALVERAPDEITREELCARLWPDGTFVEFETAIATAIRKVRQALGDSADNPIYVKTMHRRGYRFIAPVQAMGPPAAPEALPEPAGPQVEPESAPAVSAPNRPYWNNRRNLIPVLAAAGVISVLAFAAVKGPALLSRKSPPSTVNQLTTFLGDEYQPSFSPDGNQVAFVWNGEDDANVDIYVMETDGGRGIRRLTTSPAREDRPAWSPDGRWIAFMRDGHAILISPLGGSERDVGIAAGMVSWSPDGKELLFARASPRGDALLAVSVATGDTRPILGPEDRIDVFQPYGWSSDGKLLAFARFLNPSQVVSPNLVAEQPADVFIRDVARGVSRRLTNFNSSLRGFTWIPGSHDLVFCSDHGGEYLLWRTGADSPGTSDPQQLEGSGPGCGFPAASRYRATPDAAPSVILAWERREFVLNLHTFAVSAGPARRSETSIQRILPSTRTDTYPQFSPDNSRIAFVSDRSGFPEIWSADPAGSHPLKLTSFGPGARQLESPNWSPDGSQILFIDQDFLGRRFYVIPFSGGNPKLAMEAHFGEMSPSWSRDGKGVYFSSFRGGSWEIWRAVYNRAAGQLEPGDHAITGDGGVEGYESEDGKRFFYIKHWSGRDLWSVPADGQLHDPVRVVDGGIYHGWWMPAGGGIFSVDARGPAGFLPSGAPKAVNCFDLKTGRSERIAELRGRLFEIIPNFAVSSDGRRVVLGQVDYSNIDIMLIRNFH